MKKENEFLHLLEFSGNYKYLTILGCILSAMSAIFTLIPYIYIYKFIESLFMVIPNFSNAQNLETYALLAITCVLISIILSLVSLLCTHISAFENESNMKKHAMEHLVKLPLGYFQNHTSGEIRKIIDFSTAQTESFLAHMLPDLVGAFTTPIVYIIILFSFDIKLGIICLIPMIFGFYVLSKMFSIDNQNSMEKYQKCLETMNSEGLEYFRGVPVTKTFQQSIYSFKNFHKSIVEYGKWANHYAITFQLPMTSFTLAINGFFIVLIPAGILLATNPIDTHFLLSLIFYIIFTPICGYMVNKIMTISESWTMAKQSLNKIDEILNEKTLPTTTNPVTPKNNTITLKNVYFDYNKNKTDKHVLNNININIKEGEKVALVGPSGSGKSTLASLIPRFWDVDSGSINIGDVDIRNIDEKTLMEKISFVFQNTKLFKDTIYNNVAIGKTNSTKEEILKALHEARCDDIIEKLPDGVNTMINDNGVYLSGGQQQRIALARAILKDAPIIILDEATALTDPENELQIQKAINKITKDKTVITIAHRLSTIKDVDKIYVIKEGEVIEEGTHQELISNDSFYNHMWIEYNKSLNWKVNTKEGVIND